MYICSREEYISVQAPLLNNQESHELQFDVSKD